MKIRTKKNGVNKPCRVVDIWNVKNKKIFFSKKNLKKEKDEKSEKKI